MFMDDKIYNSKKLNTSEKIVLNYILAGHHRIKYLSYDVIANHTHISKSQVMRILKHFVEMGLIMQVKPRLKNYYMTIFTNDVFYDFVDDFYIIENQVIQDENIRRILNNFEKNRIDNLTKNI